MINEDELVRFNEPMPIKPADIVKGDLIRTPYGATGQVVTVRRYEREGCKVDHGYCGEMRTDDKPTGWVRMFSIPANQSLELLGVMS